MFITNANGGGNRGYLFAFLIATSLALPLTLSAKSTKPQQLSDSEVTTLEKCIIKENIDKYDQKALGEWALRTFNSKKYDKTRNDEFEFDDAKQEALKKYRDEISKVTPLAKDKIFVARIGVKFGKYNFEKNYFPIEGALEENSYVYYNYNNTYIYRATTFFNNADMEKNLLPMSKDEAKKFLKSRKDRNGYVDRELLARYTYMIESYEEKDTEIGETPGRENLTIRANLKTVEYIDPKNKKVLYKTQYEKDEETLKNIKLEKNKKIEEEKQKKSEEENLKFVSSMRFKKEYNEFKNIYSTLDLPEFLLYVEEANREFRNLGITEKLLPSGRTASEVSQMMSINKTRKKYANAKRTISFEDAKKIKSHLKEIIQKDFNITNGTLSTKEELEKNADVIVKASYSLTDPKRMINVITNPVEIDPNLKEIMLTEPQALKGKKYILHELYLHNLIFKYLYTGKNAIEFKDKSYDEYIFYFRVIESGRPGLFATLHLVDNVYGVQKEQKEQNQTKETK